MDTVMKLLTGPDTVPLLTYSGPSVTYEDVLVLPDVICIRRDLYIKTPEALQQVLEKLRLIGYRIDNLREAEDRQKRGHSVEEQERAGWSLWFASLNDDVGIRYGKCDFCGQYISYRGIRAHGRKCEHCGAVIYEHIIDGSEVEFAFEGQPYTFSKLRFTAKRCR